MKTTSHGAHLSQLTRWPLLFPVNVFLVHEADGLTLIDAGVPGCEKSILAAAAHIDAPIVRIALTHTHSDHVGSLSALHAALPRAEILVSEPSAQLLSGDFTPYTKDGGRRRGSQKPNSTKPTRLLKHGDAVGSLQVVAAPGHSPDMIAFIDTRDRTLIAGDAFQTRGGIAVSGTLRPLFPFPALATWNKQLALESARTLRELAPARLAVGHGNVLEDPLNDMDRAIATADRKLERTSVHAPQTGP